MRRSLVVLGVLFLAACQDQGPRLPAGAGGPQFSMNPGDYFGFTSPVPPGAVVPPGVFNPLADPLLEICRIDGATCTPVISATLTAGSSGAIGTLTPISVTSTEYETEWGGLNALRNANPSARYRVAVSARPLVGFQQNRILLGSVELGLAASSGAAITKPGNTWPLKFVIRVGAFCQEVDCDESYVPPTGGQIVLDEVIDGQTIKGTLGIDFPGGFCDPSNPQCANGVLVSVQRYRGPEACIPLSHDAIQWESCVTIRVAPYNVQVNNVQVGLCIDSRADSYALSGHLRMMKVKENEAGTEVLPATVQDLNAVIDPSFFFECGPEFEPTVEIGQADGEHGVFSRLAGRALHALRPVASLIGPRPLHAKRGKGPFVASLEDFSRVGAVLPVEAAFDLARDNASAMQSTTLAPSASPRVRVLANRIPGSSYTLINETRPVEGVEVNFTATAGGGSPAAPGETVLTGTDGWATATWTLGLAANNPQKLLASVLYPPTMVGLPRNGDFPNPAAAWASYTFTATATQYTVYYQSPIGSGGAPGPNVTNIAPRVRVCGPLANPSAATTAPGQTCAGNVHVTLPTPTIKSGSWDTAWKSDKATVQNTLYRIDVVIGSGDIATLPSIGSVLVRRGGGGGGIDPSGTFQFQNGSNIPVKFIVNQ